jgi:lysophospholipase L1-like esterase
MQVNMSSMNIVVLGTSVMWGQGLEDSDKIHNVLAKRLQEKHPQREINLLFLAHSGASTGYKEDGEVDTHTAPRLHGEVPTPYPTVLQEIEEFDSLDIDPESVEVVVFDAGINDVGLERILNPLTSPEDIQKVVEVYCQQHMEKLVELLVTKFSKAQIIIAAYYEFISEDCEEAYLRLLIKALNKLPGGFIADVVLGTAIHLLKQRMALNCDAFVEYSQLAFETIAKQVNSQLSSERVFVAVPNIKDEHATFGSDPWLFGINEDLTPQDPMAHLRDSECDESGILRTLPLICERASIGHPNPKGAVAYADAIFRLIQPA